MPAEEAFQSRSKGDGHATVKRKETIRCEDRFEKDWLHALCIIKGIIKNPIIYSTLMSRVFLFWKTKREIYQVTDASFQLKHQK